MPLRIGINGFGRIGRQVYKAIHDLHPDKLQVVARHRIEDVGYGHNPGRQRNLIAFKLFRVSGPIQVFMVLGDCCQLHFRLAAFASRIGRDRAWRCQRVNLLLESPPRKPRQLRASGKRTSGCTTHHEADGIADEHSVSIGRLQGLEG
jgi:hypothetical protein